MYILICEKTKIDLRILLKKIHYFTNAKYRISINWITKKVNSLFLSQEVCAFDYVLSSDISSEIILQANKIGTGHFQ